MDERRRRTKEDPQRSATPRHEAKKARDHDGACAARCVLVTANEKI
jgi:hypothetical protein